RLALAGGSFQLDLVGDRVEFGDLPLERLLEASRDRELAQLPDPVGDRLRPELLACPLPGGEALQAVEGGERVRERLGDPAAGSELAQAALDPGPLVVVAQDREPFGFGGLDSDVLTQGTEVEVRARRGLGLTRGARQPVGERL